MAAKIRSGDTVQVITGDDKGKRGKVLRVLRDTEKVLVEGMNQAWKHVKPTQQNPKGERRRIDRPLHVSNVMVVDPESDKPTRVRFEERDGVKHRVAVKSGASLGRV
ncbi:MAG: 50S ribosomal protein L24 [Planctomycetota bacterium]